MWLAGLPVADRAVLELTRRLRENELDATAERLERAYDREAKIVALDITDREAILRVLEDCPDEPDRAACHARQEHVWRQRAKASRSLERGASRTLRTGTQNHRRNRSRRGKQ